MLGGRIKLARETVGLTQAELAELIGTTQSGVASMEAGLYRPSTDYLATIQTATGFGPAFFQPSEVDDFPSGALLYRARTALSKTERQHAHGLTSVAYELALLLGKKLKQIPVNVPRLKDAPFEAAHVVRASFGLAPDSPIKDLMQSLERNGVLVLPVPLVLEHLDGFAVWVGNPTVRPVIALLGGKVGYRINFTLAEELGHLVLHSPLTVSVTEADKQAREFAQEFLLPRDAMLTEMRVPVTLSSLTELKPRWQVSLQMLIKRAADLELISANQSRYLNQQVRSAGWTKCEPGDDKIVQPLPRLIRKMAELSYGKPVDIFKIASDTGIPAGTVAQLLGLEAPRRSAKVLQFRKG